MVIVVIGGEGCGGVDGCWNSHLRHVDKRRRGRRFMFDIGRHRGSYTAPTARIWTRLYGVSNNCTKWLQNICSSSLQELLTLSYSAAYTAVVWMGGTRVDVYAFFSIIFFLTLETLLRPFFFFTVLNSIYFLRASRCIFTPLGNFNSKRGREREEAQRRKLFNATSPCTYIYIYIVR